MMKRNTLALAVSLASVPWASQVLAQQGGISAPALEIEEVFVLGEFVPDEKRDTSEISNVLDVEDLSKLGETNVGISLSRVTGLSLVGGKYVYVRGLGERYSSTLLNGTRISSPVPFQKTVPLDIIPNKIVESLLVQKTYSANYPGDFSGGVIDIRTKSTPLEDFANIKLSVGGNSETTAGDGIYYKGGDTDNWGWDDGTRDIPLNIAQLSSEEFEAVEDPQRRGLGASFFNNWDIYEKSLKPNFTGEVELGKRIDVGEESAVGFIGSFRYSNQWLNRFTDFRRYEFTGVDGGSRQTVAYDQMTSRQVIGFNGFATLGYEIDVNNAINLTYTLMRQTEDETQQNKGLSSEDDVTDGTFAQSIRLQWTDNEIETWQLSGEHYLSSLNDAEFTWRLVDGAAFRDSPDTRTYTYAENRDGLLEVVTPNRQAAGDLREVFQAPERNYARLDDSLSDYGFDFSLPFYIGDMDVVISGGAGYYERTRESEDRLFRFDLTTDTPDYVSIMFPQQLFSQDNFAKNWVTVRDFTAGAANAAGIFPFADSGEEVTSYYGSFDAQLNDRLRLQGGVRFEDVTLNADAWGGNTEQGTINAVEQQYDDVLPSLSLTYEFIENMQIRLAWSDTVNRPSLLEITGTTIRNPQNFQLYRGNVFLEPAELSNYDFRWEWYFGNTDSMSFGAFYKDFTNPIEQGKVQAQNDIFTWFNAEEAYLQGLEYDFRKELRIGEWFGVESEGWDENWLDLFTLSANASYIESEVTLLGPDETAADVPITGGRNIAQLNANERPLTGQSDVLGNILLSYDDPDRGVIASIAYNYTGERIALVGSLNDPDVLQEARGRVDVLFRWTWDEFDMVGSGLELEFKAANLFDEPIEWTQGGQVYERYNLGITYSAGVRLNL
ncbi:TonB-dependent receptor [Congregibacter variabilis]|uniref:TonB-dependent receptor n=1 Tax=Congregibacter variabilis TaxID=3081200 RepID=A0ABZ0I4B2_9GAMM|nr:TonB-dependent receptor [Congregibacter sp. IMCC43200]